MIVEKAGIDDIEELVQLRLAYLREDNGTLSIHEEKAIRSGLPFYFQETIGKNLIVFAIREDDHIVSCAFLLVVKKPMSPAFLNGETGVVLNVYTCPPYRRKGYARAIMKTLLDTAKDMNLSPIELRSTEDGYSLYKSVGFTDDDSKYHMMSWHI